MSRHHPHLYEISTVPWLIELSQTLGRGITLAEVPAKEWDALQELGFDYVWLMGVWTKSAVGRRIFQESTELYETYEGALPGWTPEDVVGSPYSIQDYAPAPEVGGWNGVDEARSQLAKRGMGLILDFVPNHMGPDHPWVTQHSDRFVLGSKERFEADPKAFFQVNGAHGEVFVAKGRDPYFDPWKDTVQINYFQPAARRAMIETLKNIHQHADGVRCDMAMLVLNDIFARTWGHVLREAPPKAEFWEEARPELPGMVWIAEAYWGTEYRLQQLGFDFVYDKTLYDRLRHAPPQEVRGHLQADWDYQRKLVRFIENHDEPRAAGVFEREKLRAAAVVFGTLPGLKLYNQGQLEGKRIHLPVQLGRAREEEPDAELRRFYRRVLEATDHACFHEGSWRLLDVQPAYDDTHRNIVCHLWQLDDEVRLVATNLASHHSQGRVSLKGAVADDRDHRLRDLLNDESFQRGGAELCGEGLHIVLAGFGSHIFSFE